VSEAGDQGSRVNPERAPDPRGEADDDRPPPLAGLHHVRVPARDLDADRDWYVETLGFASVLEYELEDELVGISLIHPSGLTIALHHAPAQADALAGFTLLALDVGNHSLLENWEKWLERRGVVHTRIGEGPLGWHIELREPNGMFIELHTGEHPISDDA
jgi:catechol 2,3-dioxygenase-like lactoylglutathione lyase family enzyme